MSRPWVGRPVAVADHRPVHRITLGLVVPELKFPGGITHWN
jgi:hypothetical protein